MADNIVVNETTYNDVEAVSMVNENGDEILYYPDAVRYNAQNLTEAQKAQARENIGAITEKDAPVKSVNNKTGAVSLNAEDVGARSNTWMPSATDVGARPNTWTPSFSDVGADKSGTAESKVSTHNVSDASHSDIRLLIQGLGERLNAIANSTDIDLDDFKEVVAYIKANRGLIDAITTNKINYTDIINDLVTNVTNKPLSAAQGVALKLLIDNLTNSKLDASDLASAINTALAQAKASGEFKGEDGQRGTGILKVSTAPESYTTTTAGIAPIKRMALSTIKTQSGVSEVLVGDCVAYSYYLYHIYYFDATYAYMDKYQSIRGATGAVGTNGADGKTPYIQNGYWYINGVNQGVKAQGTDGYTPVMGTDYWTPTDKEEITAEANALIATELAKRGQLKPEFAESKEWLEANGDTSKLYVLPDGYIYAYMTTKTSEGGIKTVTDRVTEGFLDNNRLSTSSGTPKTATGFVTTPLIDISNLSNWKIRLTGIQWSNTDDASTTGDGFAYSVWNNETLYQCGYTDHVGIDEEYFESKNFKINIISTNELELSPYNNSVNVPYTHVRASGKGASSDAIVEVIYEVATEPSLETKWTNTGHAFIPADYEDRIIEVEDDVSKLKVKSTEFERRICSLEASEGGSVPTYVVTEAAEVANKVLSVRNAYSFVFGALSDLHSTGSDVSTLHAGQGMYEIDKLTTLDACLNFGDGIDNYFENVNADSFLHIHRCLHSVQREIPYIQMQGNHDQLKTDTTKDAQQKYFAYIGANNIGTITDWDNRFRNYGYRDFSDQRMRVIYLNSVDVSEGENTDDCWLSAMQLSWLVNTALDFTSKNGWSFIVCCHHPLNWWYMDNLLAILNAYKGKASGSVTVGGTTVNYNFATATAEFIAHFHGHLHNFRAETLGTSGVLSITIPNACFGRNNEYGTSSSYTDDIKANYGDVDENGIQRQFNKTTGTAEDTAFNVVAIDRENRKIHCINYGAGIDREISY